MGYNKEQYCHQRLCTALSTAISGYQVVIHDHFFKVKEAACAML